MAVGVRQPRRHPNPVRLSTTKLCLIRATGKLRPVATYETVEQALKALRDPQTLAEVASVLLQNEYPGRAMSATPGDRGRAGRVQLAIWGEEFAVVQYSLAARWPRKVESELK